MARIFFETQVESVRDKLKKGNDEFEISHAMCAFIAEGLSKYVETASSIQLSQITAILKTFKTTFEKAVDFKVSDELRMDLPNEVVVEHSFYRLNSVRFYHGLNFWLDFVESTLNGLLNAKELFNQWITLTKIFDSADKLLKTLIAKGDMDPKHSKELISRTYREVLEGLCAGFTDQFKIEKAQKYISEKPWKDNP
jgi:hypothetical protein